MTSLKKFEDNPQKQLMEQIADARCVMLGSTRHNDHMQPMTPQIDDDEEGHTIYFYSDKTSELGTQILMQPGNVHMCHIGKDYQACVKGRLSVERNPAMVDTFWNPIVAAWYPGGKTDPKMLMLKFEPDTAHVWASDKSSIGFAYEITKANLTDEMPDIGKSKEITL